MSIVDMSTLYDYHNIQHDMSSFHQQTFMPQSSLWNNQLLRANLALMTQGGISTTLPNVGSGSTTKVGDQSNLFNVPKSLLNDSHLPLKLKQQDDDGAFTPGMSSEHTILPTNDNFLLNFCLECGEEVTVEELFCLECKDKITVQDTESSSLREENSVPLSVSFEDIDFSSSSEEKTTPYSLSRKEDSTADFDYDDDEIMGLYRALGLDNFIDEATI